MIRALWDTQTREWVRVEGAQAVGAKLAGAPRRADLGGCEPSADVAPHRPGGRLGGCRAWAISAAAINCPRATRSSTRVHQAAGREPSAVRRLLNIRPETDRGLLGDLALADGVSAFILASDDPARIERYGREVAPQVNALVAVGRAGGP